MKRLRWLALVSWVAGCGSGSDSPPDSSLADAASDAAAVTATVYTPPAPGATADWGSMPYPSDLWLDGSGHLALATLPVGTSSDPAQVATMKQALATLDGAGVWSNVYFPVSGAV